MELSDSFDLWADSHVFYDGLTGGTRIDGAIGARLEAWNRRMVHQTPNGALLEKNSMFDLVRTTGKVSLLHVTHAFDEIAARGVLYPSGGCLVGSVYGTPLTPESGSYRLHNLGRYILEREAVMAAGAGRALAEPIPLIVEVEVPRTAIRMPVGIDYLRLGEIHLSIYRHLEYLLGRDERYALRDSVVERTRRAMPFLTSCLIRTMGDTPAKTAGFHEKLVEAIPAVPILGYIYFEAISEYLMLHSRSEVSQRLMARGEFDNWTYKRLLFAAFPGMAGRFDLSQFTLSSSRLQQYLADIAPGIDLVDLLRYVADRVSLLVCARLLGPTTQSVDWRKLRWEFNELLPYAAPLLGHLIHRELRTFGRYPDFYFYFDQYKALQAWNYWNHMDVVFPFNAAMPKGEIGLNPAYPSIRTKVYRGEVVEPGWIRPLEEVEVAIAPRLVDLRYTLMRSRGGGTVSVAS
ncbi:hypothetical protein ACWF0M_04500 [Kribbella sp. NPDC055110]